MSQPIDLGRCFYHATDSHLQLEFSGVAHFARPNAHTSSKSPFGYWQWAEPLSAWITEGPELEICLSIGVRSGLELAASAFVSDLAEMVCNSKVWPDLGFAIILKSIRSDNNTDARRTHCFIFGLCRAPRLSNSTKGRALPNVLRNPPDAHAPTDVPTISLASIDIRAEYTYPQREDNTCKTIQYSNQQLSQLQWRFLVAECHHPVNTETLAVAAISWSSCEPGILSVQHEISFLEQGTEQPLPPHGPTSDLSEVMLRLIDIGLRKLIISPNARDSQIKVAGEDTLKCLSDLVPAVFNPGYREAMHQRAASIPIISKALTSMLENSHSPIIQGRVSAIFEQTNNSSKGTPPPESHEASLNSIIHSSLWRIAQQRTRRPRVSNRSQVFFTASPDLPHHYPNETATMSPVEKSYFLDSDPLDLDNINDNGWENTYMGFPPGDEDLLVESASESAFEDLSESTQTTMDVTFQDCEPCLLPHSDTEMLIEDDDILDT